MRYTLLSINFRLMAAIFDFQHTQTSDSVPISLSVLPDPENMGIAMELFSYHVYFRFGGHHLGYATSDFVVLHS